MKLTIQQVAYHRNGISGAPFHIVLFQDAEEGPMLGIVFAEPYCVAVLHRDKLAAGDIAFMSNSWRGDWYEPSLRTAIQQFNTQEISQ